MKISVPHQVCLTLLLFLYSSFLAAQKLPTVVLTLKDHLFFPAEITIEANTKVQLVITNLDQQAEQFESFELNREKVIFPQQTKTIYIGPLQPGSYHFFGEFNPHSAQGVIHVVAQGENYAN